MAEERFTYHTIIGPSEEVLFKDRGSKFYGYAFPVASEEDITEVLNGLKKEHHSARHFCYAWFLGQRYERYRANDDGEPSNSAGAPILGQLQAYDLTNTFIVVVRYFGGTKLGVGGLIQAYKQTAKLAIEASNILEIPFETKVNLVFDYSEMNVVMRLIKQENLKIVEQESSNQCELTIAIPDRRFERIFHSLKSLHKINVRKVD